MPLWLGWVALSPGDTSVSCQAVRGRTGCCPGDHGRDEYLLSGWGFPSCKRRRTASGSSGEEALALSFMNIAFASLSLPRRNLQPWTFDILRGALDSVQTENGTGTCGTTAWSCRSAYRNRFLAGGECPFAWESRDRNGRAGA